MRTDGDLYDRLPPEARTSVASVFREIRLARLAELEREERLSALDPTPGQRDTEWTEGRG
jgi:hypothetical protein